MKVKDRTSELEFAKNEADARTNQLKIITDLLQTIAIVQDPKELLPLMVKQISHRLGFYHVGIFLLDDKRGYAILRASNSDGGQRMLDRGHQLKIGGAGIVGYVAQSGRPRIASDTGADAFFFKNPDLPETRSEAALPLMVGEEVIGVLDVQSTQASAFNKDDVEILNTLANQVAIIIQNARLFEQLHITLQSYTKTGRETWLENTSGYVYLPDGAVKNVTLADAQMSGPAITSTQNVVINSGSDGSAPSLALPVKLRDKVIGIIHIEATEANRKWSDDEIAMVQSISERAALALENARLFEEASRRAEHERIVSQVTSRISESTNFDRILQTTIQELGRSLGAARTFIQLETEATNGKGDVSPDSLSS
jgi:GAF domain-containing protein